MLLNKSIVIIGGTTGIGLSAARAFAGAGARLVLVGRSADSCEKAKELLGAAVTVYAADASHPDTAVHAIALCHQQFGSFHGLYHIAGGSGRKYGDGPLHELTLEGWNKTFEMNLASLMLSNQAAVKMFRALKQGGSILNMGSVLGFSPSPKYFVTHAYAAAKSAVIGFTKSIAAYYAQDDIRVNLLAPALVATPMSERASNDKDILEFIATKQPLDGGRNGRPEDLDGAAIYFMSDASRFTTGQTLYVDGGWELSEGQYKKDRKMEIAIGIDLGGTNVKGVLLNREGEVLTSHSIATNDENNTAWYNSVIQMVNHLRAQCQHPVAVVGLSCPGLANGANTSIAYLPHRLPGIENLNWEDHFKTKTFVINDAHAALIAEAKLGAIRGYQHAVLLTLGTGVGGGILVDGELYQGQSGMAGHFGHVCINPNDDELSIVGMPGSLEYAIGNYSVQRRSSGRFQSTRELVDAYKASDIFATWLWLDLVRKLSLSIASIANSLSPQIIVLAGGITGAGDALMQPLGQFLSVYEYRPSNKTTPVKLAKFSDLSGAIGAAAFAFTKLINKEP